MAAGSASKTNINYFNGDNSPPVSKGTDRRLEDFDRSIANYFTIGRKTSGEIFEKKNRASQSVIQSNFSKTKFGNGEATHDAAVKLDIGSRASFIGTIKSQNSSNGLPGASTTSFMSASRHPRSNNLSMT